MTHDEPLLSVLVLDFLKESETRTCLESIKSHVKVPHQVIYLHNGPADYPYQLFKEGLVDHFIQRKTNGGLGLGTRDLFAATFSPYVLYLQNDQQLIRDIDDNVFRYLVNALDRHIDHPTWPVATIKSISLAGPVGGQGIYSERCHFIRASFYRDMENTGILGPYGAGPFHDGPWREKQIQDHYRKHHFVHDTTIPSIVKDNGRLAKRQNPDGSIWQHKPDTKELTLISGPVKETYVYPNLTPDEWAGVISTQTWEAGKIPEREKASSFKAFND